MSLPATLFMKIGSWAQAGLVGPLAEISRTYALLQSLHSIYRVTVIANKGRPPPPVEFRDLFPMAYKLAGGKTENEEAAMRWWKQVEEIRKAEASES